MQIPYVPEDAMLVTQVPQNATLASKEVTGVDPVP